ncbi:MAG: extracellular solute-binding protein [Xenococcus sp. (in: cyanobacteria)]
MSANFLSQSWVAKLVLVSALLLSSCRSSSPETETRKGNILVWHNLSGQAGEVLESIFAQYSALHPQVTIIPKYIESSFQTESSINKQFIEKTKKGLGPDLFISLDAYIPFFVEAGTISYLQEGDIDSSIYLPQTLDSVRYQGKLYGVPWASEIQGLCYNKDLVTQPATTLQTLVEEAQAGRKIAFPSVLGRMLWGVKLFGGQLFDAQGSKALDQEGFAELQEGFAEWLEWLSEVYNRPNFIFESNFKILRQAFIDGELAYYVCYSHEVIELKAAMGADRFGITSLPTRAEQPAAPVLVTFVMLFNSASSTGSREVALDLAKFLTNVQQQKKLSVETEALIATNVRVKLDAGLFPTQTALLSQSRTSIVIPLESIKQAREALGKYGNQLYNQVLQGQIEPTEAARKITEKLNRLFDLE